MLLSSPLSSDETSGSAPFSDQSNSSSELAPSVDHLGLGGLPLLTENTRGEADSNMYRLSADPVTRFDVVTGEASYVHDLRGEFDNECSPYHPRVKVCLPSSSNYFGGSEIRAVGEAERELGDDILVGGVVVCDEVHESGVDQTEAEGEGGGETDAEGEDEGDDVDPGRLDERWRQQMITVDGEGIANRIYQIPDGYHLHLPPSGSSVHDPPDGHAVVYLRHLEVGLRFPLHRRVEFILCRMNVSLAQLTPLLSGLSLLLFGFVILKGLSLLLIYFGHFIILHRFRATILLTDV